MSFTKTIEPDRVLGSSDMPTRVAKLVTAATIMGAGIALSACTESRLRLSDDYGVAVRQNEAAQVANPDARYEGVPAPGSNGRRVVSSVERYEKGQVIQPATTSTQNVVTGGQSGGASGGESTPSGAQ
jgi:hypothetical protein